VILDAMDPDYGPCPLCGRLARITMVSGNAEQMVVCSSGPMFFITYEMGRRLLDPSSEESKAKGTLSGAVQRSCRIGIPPLHISSANYGALL
jgi:hypothetical protein